MKLSERERDILACTRFRADMPVEQVAHALGLRSHSVRASLKRLREQGIIFIRPLINPYALGIVEAEALISVITPGEAARQRVIEAFIASPFTSYVAEVGGDYHLSVMFQVNSLGQVAEVFDRVCEAIPGIQFERIVFPVIEMTLYYPKFLSSRRVVESSMKYRNPGQRATCDELDERILDALAHKDTSSKSGLARVLGIPLTTLEYRLKTLRERGILLGIGYGIPSFKDGLTPYALLLTTKRSGADFYSLIHHVAEQHPSVSYLMRAVGPWEYEMGVRLSDPRALTSITQEFLKVFEKFVSRIDVVPVYRLSKFDSFPKGLRGQAPQSRLSKAAAHGRP